MDEVGKIPTVIGKVNYVYMYVHMNMTVNMSTSIWIVRSLVLSELSLSKFAGLSQFTETTF